MKRTEDIISYLLAPRDPKQMNENEWAGPCLRSAPGASPPLDVSLPSTSASAGAIIAIVMPTAVSAGRALRVMTCALVIPREKLLGGRCQLTELAVNILLKSLIALTPARDKYNLSTGLAFRIETVL